MKLFFEYLRQRRNGIILFLLFTLVFALVFILYKISFTAVLYPFLLCTIIGIIFFIFDFRSVKKSTKSFAKSDSSPRQ